MHFILFCSSVIILSIANSTKGCHNPYHGGNGINSAVPGDFEGSLRDKLSDHGLPNSIINCAVAKASPFRRTIRSSFFDPDDLPPVGPGLPPIGPGVPRPVDPNSPSDLKAECRTDRSLCLAVLECAEEQDIEQIVDQLSFLTPAPPTTTTTTTTTPPPTLAPILIPEIIPPFPDFQIPGIPDFNFPKFPKPPRPALPSVCRNKNCSGLFCKLRCNGKRLEKS